LGAKADRRCGAGRAGAVRDGGHAARRAGAPTVPRTSRACWPRGLNALGNARSPCPRAARRGSALIRTGPSRSERLELIVLAATITGGVESTATALARVELFPHRPLLPRLRIPLAVAGGLLLAAAVAAELWRRL
jgi:hypothetical protein